MSDDEAVIFEEGGSDDVQVTVGQAVEYLVATNPLLPSEQGGTARFDRAAMEIPEIAEAVYNPPEALPTRYTEDGEKFLRYRVKWHGQKVTAEDGMQMDGEYPEIELGLEQARKLPGWHEETRTYVVQYHPDDPEETRIGEPDWMEPTGSLPSGHEFSPAKGILVRRHKTMSLDERMQRKAMREWEAMGKHFD